MNKFFAHKHGEFFWIDNRNNKRIVESFKIQETNREDIIKKLKQILKQKTGIRNPKLYFTF